MITTVFAQVTNRGIPTLSGLFSGTGSGAAFLGALLSLVVTIILIVGGLYFFIQLLTGGVAWIGSGGDKGKLEEARQKIFSAVLGLVLLFSAFAFIRLAESVFQVGILNFNVPTIGAPPTSGGIRQDCTAAPCLCNGSMCNGICQANGVCSAP